MAKYNRKYNYSLDEDYGTKAYEAAQRGDLEGAENYERTRNYKIDKEDLPYEKTYNYIDIGSDLRDAMENGESGTYVKSLANARESKALNNTKLNPYYDDEIQRRANNYYYNEMSGVGGNYQNRPQYNEEYTKEVDKLVDKILNRDAFEYDAEADPSYQAYKTAAVREGERAMRDTLAEYSQLAGGMNSYAVSASQQAMNNYLSQLNDKMPEFYNDAYDRYLNEYAQDKSDLQTLLDIQSKDYNQYLSDYNVFNNDRGFAADEAQREYENNYRQRRNAVEDERYTSEWEYQKSENEKAQNLGMLEYLISNGQPVPSYMIEAAGFKDINEALAAIAARNGELFDLEREQGKLGLEQSRLNNALLNKELQWYDYNAAGSGRKSSGSSSGRSSGSSSSDLSSLLDGSDDESGETPKSEPAEDNASQTFFNNLLSEFSNDTKDNQKVRQFITNELKPAYEKNNGISDEDFQKLIVGDNVKKSNSTTYDLDIEEIQKIGDALNRDTGWLQSYKNRWGFNSGKGIKSK